MEDIMGVELTLADIIIGGGFVAVAVIFAIGFVILKIMGKV